ncbi:MAG TPA: glycosyltransferase family 2 protein [Anaerolineales bacterium]|nr:glycosyltransferase family 2 protein [Anaerolineales bacterium]HNQ94798.1 glycosyltransferase family 2 protein [Anaerolineales bacterium]HNS61059.1 glycosyltransferase family 2 protein [Anaerolineales bacterium]
MNISIVVPVYRGEALIEPLVERLAKSLPTFSKKYEVLLVNDGSPDNSWDVIQKLARKYKWVRGIRLMRNYGQHNATLCGVRAAQYEITITMDQDLQHPPEEIPVLLKQLENGFDVVYGAPKKLPQGFVRNAMTANIKNILARVMGISSVKHISAFRAFRTELRNAFTNFQSPTLIIDVLLSWGTSRFTSVLVEIERPEERSNYNFSALVKAALLILTGYSTTPLRLASWIGFVMTVFGLGVFIYVIVISFMEGGIPGFPFLASIIALFSGAQLFALGIFGEYLARMFDRSMDRPTYIVSELAGK